MNAFRVICLLLLTGCAGNQDYDPLSDYDELDAKTILEAPSAQPGRFAPAERDIVYRGERGSRRGASGRTCDGRLRLFRHLP